MVSNISDEDMQSTIMETKHPNDSPAKDKIILNKDKTKHIFSELAEKRRTRFDVNPKISKVMKQLWNLRHPHHI